MNSRAFRFQPGAPPPERTIARQRLNARLRERFSARLTVMCGVAGAGKSTALAQAIANNELDPAGVDHWLGLSARDVDPVQLLSGLSIAVGLEEPTTDIIGTIDAIADEVWRRSPSEVAIVIDDVHHLGPEAMKAVRELLETLPANGHLLLAGRTLPDGLPLARMRAHGTLCELTEQDLSFTDDDLRQLRSARESVAEVSDLPRHPATADLALAAGADAGSEFLWEEVLSPIPSDRLIALQCASVLDDFDDELALAVSDGAFDAAELTAGLPMVATNESGRTSMHSLLRAALDERLTPDMATKAARFAAQTEVARGNLAAAIRLLADGVDDAGVVDIARTFMFLPILSTPLGDIATVAQAMASASPGSPLTRFFTCQARTDVRSPFVLDEFRTLADEARAMGDAEFEAAALHRAIQGELIESNASDLLMLQRLKDLGSEVPFARGVGAYYDSLTLQHMGQPEKAQALLSELDVLDPAIRAVQRAERLVDLGRPEEVGRHIGLDDLADLPVGTEIFQSFAMWLRGETTPEIAEQIAAAMVTPTLARGHQHTSISLLGVTTMVALAAGLNDVAHERATMARELQPFCPPVMSAFGGLSGASVALVTEGEEQARELLEQALTELPVQLSPKRPHLMCLPLLYSLAPQTRETLERWPFGRPLSIAIQAGQALVAVRETQDTGPACDLPWNEESILRAHVLAPQLCELAATAASQGVGEAKDLMDRLPNRRALLERVATCDSEAAAKWCQDQLELLPARPRQSVSVQTLGTFTLFRDGHTVDDGDWVRRSRVRELFGLLVEVGRLSRSDAIEMLWPDQDGDKATSSLRVTLSYLRRVLEPDRLKTEASYYLSTEGETLELSSDIIVDVTAFDAQLDAARSMDQSGSPAEALITYRDALDLYQGPYLAEFDATWVMSTRLRLQSLATATSCRIGELTLARGEPEEACRWAVKARAMDQLNERAARLFVSSLASTGDRSAAVRAGRSFTEELNSAGLTAGPETAKLLSKLIS